MYLRSTSTKSTLGYVAFNQKNYERATASLQESLVSRREVGSKPGVAECLERLGGGGGCVHWTRRTE
jgi:uncharacterized protein HemY